MDGHTNSDCICRTVIFFSNTGGGTYGAVVSIGPVKVYNAKQHTEEVKHKSQYFSTTKPSTVLRCACDWGKASPHNALAANWSITRMSNAWLFH